MRRSVPILTGLLIALQGCANLAPLPELPPPSAAPLSVIGAQGTPLPPDTQRRVERAIAAQDDGAVRRHLASMQAVSGTPLITGNRVRLLVDGPSAYAAMFAAIAAARAEIVIEMFIFEEAHHGSGTLSDLLLRKAAEGVPVSVLYDGVGSRGTPAEFLRRLAEGGIALCEFNPLSPARLRGKPDFTHRDHRKIVIVDGTVAYAGGINFSGTYSSGFTTPARPRRGGDQGRLARHQRRGRG